MNNSNLNYLLKNGWEDNLGRIIVFQKDLVMYKQVLDGVYNLTVYFRTDDYVIDSNSFYMRSGGNPAAPAYHCVR